VAAKVGVAVAAMEEEAMAADSVGVPAEVAGKVVAVATEEAKVGVVENRAQLCTSIFQCRTLSRSYCLRELLQFWFYSPNDLKPPYRCHNSLQIQQIL
jgi:hypothetical protein